MASFNQITVIGNVGQDIDLRRTTAGKSVVNFTVATNESYTDNSGQRVEQTEWHRVVAWERMADTCHQYLNKGSLVHVVGKMSYRKYTAKDGTDKVVAEIVAQRMTLLEKSDGGRERGDGRDSGGGGAREREGGRESERGGGRGYGGGSGGYDGSFDDDIPF